MRYRWKIVCEKAVYWWNRLRTLGVPEFPEMPERGPETPRNIFQRYVEATRST